MSNGEYISFFKTAPFYIKSAALVLCVGFACVLSLVFTLSFWASLGTTVASTWLLCIAGCVFDITKYLALPAFLDFKAAKQYFKAAISLAMFLVLSLVSMLAGIYVMNSNVEFSAKTKLLGDAQLVSLENSMKIQASKISNLMALAKKDSDSGYRSRAKKILSEVGVEQNILSEMENKHSRVSQTIKNTSSSIGLPIASEKVKSAIVVGLGALLEITLTFLFCVARAGASNAPRSKMPLEQRPYFRCKPPIFETSNNGRWSILKCGTATQEQAGTFEEHATPTPATLEEQYAPERRAHKEHNVPGSGTFQEHNVPSMGAKYKEVVRNVLEQKWLPTQREIKRKAKLGSNKVANYFRQMERDGVLIKSQNKRYVLNEAT